MHIAVLVGVFHVGKCLTPVGRFLNRRTYQVEPVKMMGTSEDLLVIMRPRAATNSVGAFGPTRTTIIGSPDTTLTTIELDRCINHVRILLGDGQTNLTHIPRGQTGAQSLPRVPTVH